MPGQRYFFGNGVIVNNVRYVCIKDHNPPPPPRPPATSPTFWQPISQAVNPVATGAAGSKNADVKFADGVDKEGTLLNRTWFLPPPPPPPPPPATLPRVIFENQICLISPNNGGNAYYIVPIIVSSGKDGKMGLNAYCGPVSTDATDNIYSFKLRGQ
jgi:hypothetical protein